MKKLMLMLAVFGGVFSLCAGELSAEGWKTHAGHGKFVFNKEKYPLKMSCQTPGVDKKTGKPAVWGRFHRKETVEVGKKYEIKVTFTMTNSKKGMLAVWVRGGGMFNLFSRVIDNQKTLSRTFTATKDEVSIYLNLLDGTADLEFISVELNPVE